MVVASSYLFLALNPLFLVAWIILGLTSKLRVVNWLLLNQSLLLKSPQIEPLPCHDFMFASKVLWLA